MDQRKFSLTELSKLSSRANLHLLVHGKVYDLHEFVNEHPGGDLVLLGEGGKDATKAWDDVEHSDEAQEMMKEYLVGHCPEAAFASSQTISSSDVRKIAQPPQCGGGFTPLLLIFLLGVVVSSAAYMAS